MHASIYWAGWLAGGQQSAVLGVPALVSATLLLAN